MPAEYYYKEYYGINTTFPLLISSDLLKKYLTSEVLDVGCGHGSMVKELSKHMKVSGCDIWPSVSELGKNFFFHNMEEKPTIKKFNSIYSIHVLEHIFDYISFLKNIRNSLKSQGILFLAVPNCYSLLSRTKFLFGNENITMGVGEIGCVEKNCLEPHLRFFGKKSLKKILEKNGFEVKEIFGTRGGKKTSLGTFAGQLNFVCKKID
ncbi:class I SAM-dependent methyltransferase [Candidatus Micrarchaeota archaeon]|nr:class I SAM-dependent methyltransferase [Candidatus Micrarchaeota archaeon]